MKTKRLPFIFIFSFFPFLLLKAQTINTVAGNSVPGYSGNGGNATNSEINDPSNLSFDRAGNMYIADFDNQVIREVNASGIISTIAGNNVLGYNGNGGPATAAEFHNPVGVITNDSGMFIADNLNYVIRRVYGGIITNYAGNHTAGYSGDGGPATSAQIRSAFDITTFNGSIYFTDNGSEVVRKVDSAGIISTVAGNNVAGYYGDGGPATLAEIRFPNGIGFDHAGNMYFSDENNAVVRKVNTGGIISTIAGNTVDGYYGDGGPATLAELHTDVGLTADSAGNVYIGDWGNSIIRMVNTAGIISTIAGNNAFGNGYSGNGGPATLAEINHPNGVAVDYSGNLYIADQANNVIREIPGILTGNQNLLQTNSGISVFPNPSNGIFTITLPHAELVSASHETSSGQAQTTIEIYNVLGEMVETQCIASLQYKPFTIDLHSKSNGVYFYRVLNQDGGLVGEGKLIIQK